jgi:hypothetical protein
MDQSGGKFNQFGRVDPDRHRQAGLALLVIGACFEYLSG